MSGGDDKSSSRDSESETAAAATTAPTSSTSVPSYMPGQLEAISAQLGASYGMPTADVLTYLQTIYPSPEQKAAQQAAQQAATTTSSSSDKLGSIPADASEEEKLEFLLRYLGGAR